MNARRLFNAQNTFYKHSRRVIYINNDLNAIWNSYMCKLHPKCTLEEVYIHK